MMGTFAVVQMAEKKVERKAAEMAGQKVGKKAWMMVALKE